MVLPAVNGCAERSAAGRAPPAVIGRAARVDAVADGQQPMHAFIDTALDVCRALSP
jgi:hypothetical protein